MFYYRQRQPQQPAFDLGGRIDPEELNRIMNRAMRGPENAQEAERRRAMRRLWDEAQQEEELRIFRGGLPRF